MRVHTKYSCVIDKSQTVNVDLAVPCWVAEGRVTASPALSSAVSVRNLLDWRAMFDCAVLSQIFPAELMAELACAAVCGTRLWSLPRTTPAGVAPNAEGLAPPRTHHELLFMITRREQRGIPGSRRVGGAYASEPIVGRMLIETEESVRRAERERTVVGLEWVASGQRIRVFLPHRKTPEPGAPAVKNLELALLYGAAGTLSTPAGETGIWCVAANQVADRRLCTPLEAEAGAAATGGVVSRHDHAEFLEIDLTESHSPANWPVRRE